MSNTFSLLSKGYGTWDGIAKFDRNDFLDRTSGYFSLDEFYLPSIETKYQRTGERKDYAPIFYQNKPFKLPKVEGNTLYPLAPVPKTYTTRKGALLLYAEDYFIPGSPKMSRRKKKKPKRQSAVIFKTLGDLRNSILNYKKNGGDPLFLKLLQKSYSNYRELTVRPGLSPKRYIASLCRMHQEDSWKKYITDHDTEFLTLPDKPQPYSTMSLPPISPSGSMVDSSFNFYQNGMSTGAASLISINSEDVPEYAFSSRAVSPLESLSERLSEVEILPCRKDNQYASLNPQQKADLLSQLLVHSTFQGDSDMENWVNDKLTESGNIESKHSISRTFSNMGKTNLGNLKSANNFSSYLPPIHSAEPLSTSPSTVSASQNNFGFLEVDKSHREHSNEHVNLDVLDPSAVELFLDKNSDQEKVLEMVEITDIEQKSISQSESNLDNSISSGINSHSSKTFVKGESGELPFGNIPLRSSGTNLDKCYEDNKSFKLEVKCTSSGTLDTLIAAKDTVEQEVQEVGSKENENSNDSEMDVDISKIEIEVQSLPVEDSRSNRAESNSSSLPPHISIEELHGHAKLVATTVLSRPKSGANFQADAKEAVSMWADRLSSILGPPSKEPRICSAGRSPTTIARGNGEDSVTPIDAGGAYPFSTATRHRKKSYSANPSVVALRETLKISGENGKDELLQAVGSLADKINKMSARGNAEIPNRMKNGHIYHEPSKDEDAVGSPGPTKSIQSERVSLADIQMDIVSIVTGQKENTLNYQQAELLSELASEEEDNFREAVLSVLSNHSDQILTVLPETSKAEAIVKPETSSGKSRTAVIKSNKTKTSTATPPFQVSTRPKTEKPPTSLYSAPKTETKAAKQEKKLTFKPVTKATGKVPKQSKEKQNVKGKVKRKKGKKGKKSQSPKPEEEITMEPVVEEEKSISPIRVNSETGEKEPEVFRVASSDSKSKRSIASSKVASPERTPVIPASDTPKLVRRAVEKTEDAKNDDREAEERLREEQEQKERDSKAQRKAAIAAERAAAAERRRLEVERKRREREEAKRKALEEEARLETLRMQEEEEMRRKEEERRRLREEKEEENRRKVEQEKEQERLAQAKLERERRQREEWKRKQQELLEKRKHEEELRREQEKLEAEIAAVAKREQQEKLKAMEETERRAFEERMKREEEELRKRLELQRLKEEEEKRLQEEHRRKHQEQLALLRQKQIQRQLFLAALAKEKFFLTLDQRMTRAFTYSYFALLPWCVLENLKPNGSLEDRSLNNEQPLTVPEEES